mgnify:CR=1 FL=1
MERIGFKIDESALEYHEKEIVKEAEEAVRARCGYQKWLGRFTPRRQLQVVVQLQQDSEDPGDVDSIQIPTECYYGNQKDSCSKQCGQELPLCGPRLFEYNCGGSGM